MLKPKRDCPLCGGCGYVYWDEDTGEAVQPHEFEARFVLKDVCPNCFTEEEVEVLRIRREMKEEKRS